MINPTPEMIEAAKAKGREMAGNQPGALVEAFAEVAEAGATAALAIVPGEPVAQMHDSGDGFGLRPIWLGSVPAEGAFLYAAPAPQPVSVKALRELIISGIKDQGYGYTLKGDKLTVSSDEVFAVNIVDLANFIRSALSSPVEGGTEKEERVRLSKEAAADAALDLLQKNGWKPGDKMSVHSVSQLMGDFALIVDRGEIQCDWPNCGCCADAACRDAVTFMERTSPSTSAEPEEIQIENNFLNENDALRAEIEALRVENERMKEAGSRLLKACDVFDGDELHTDDSVCAYSDALEDFRAALQQQGEGK